MNKVLVVDDEETLRSVVAGVLAARGFQVFEAATGEDALLMSERDRYDLVLLDLTLPGMNGLETLRLLHDRDPELSVVLITAHGSVKTAVDAMRQGAFDYLPKPVDYEELLITVKRALETRRLKAEVADLRGALRARYGFGGMVGASAPMQAALDLMAKASVRDVTVLILGESGTGKELAARGIHQASARSRGPFVAVNCSAIPATLVENEFFGHERGAFTDAKEARRGRFEEANGGTLFLDEIGDLSLDAQAKLLRALQEGKVARLGSSRETKVDVRVISATNKNLDAEVRRRHFREDLYYRLNVVTVKLPPLRERAEDLNALIDILLEQNADRLKMPTPTIAAAARRQLMTHDWPGNVRELDHALQHALVAMEGDTVRLEHLPPRARGLDDESATDAKDMLTLPEAVRRTTERVERGLIVSALSETNGNRSAAAQRLGIDRKTLFNKVREYGLASAHEDTDSTG